MQFHTRPREWLMSVCALALICFEHDLDLKPPAPEPSHLALRFDGLYQSELRPPELATETFQVRLFLRFYADGTVIEVCSLGTHDEVARWFDRRHPAAARRTYTLTGRGIEWSWRLGNGDVMGYRGWHDGTQLRVRCWDAFRTYPKEETFTFVPTGAAP